MFLEKTVGVFVDERTVARCVKDIHKVVKICTLNYDFNKLLQYNIIQTVIIF